MTAHIDALWQTYRDQVIAPETGHAQVLETKRAFFSGALALMNAMMGPLLDASDEPTEADMRRMAEITDELEAFGRSGGLI